jgi:hypothetical protein
MCEVIPQLCFMAEVRENGVPINVEKGHIHCKVFEDNSGALEMVKVPKFCPRAKHINIKCHHFLEHVASGFFLLNPVTTEQQLVHIFTKLLTETLFTNHCKAIMGWYQ